MSPKDIVKATIHFKTPPREPYFIHLWAYADGLGTEHVKEMTELLSMYPTDFDYFMPNMPGETSSLPDYDWVPRDGSVDQHAAIDARILLKDWDQLDTILSHFPSPNIPEFFQNMTFQGYSSEKDPYRICHFHYFFFERLWSLRGMENALMDLCLYPEEVKRLFSAFADFYIALLHRAKEEMSCDALFVTDDLGTQNGPMFSPALFRELFKPFYKRVIDECHALGMDFWLHSCGDVTLLMDDFIDLKIDVLHPIQKFAMDQERIGEQYRGKICFWAGVDMQECMMHGTPDDVAGEVDRLRKCFATERGGCFIGLGNGLTPDVKFENIRALFEKVANS